VAGRLYTVEAEFEIPEGSPGGVIVSDTAFVGGFGLWSDEEAGSPAQVGAGIPRDD
jgi:hypothetical protein